jgi:hypothetical protein
VKRGLAACVFLATLALPESGGAAYGIATGSSSPTLRVDAQGNAEVGWTAGGKHDSFIVPLTGIGHHGTLTAPNVFKRARVSLPMAVVTGKTPDGTLWALQQRAISGQPTSLDLSRWRGAPTKVTLATDGKRLTGTASFNGHPVTGSSPTLTGKKVRAYVYLECFGCAGKPGWTLMLGVAPKANGSFAVFLQSRWTAGRYRATLQGPNVGGELAPDAQAVLKTA